MVNRFSKLALPMIAVGALTIVVGGRQIRRVVLASADQVDPQTKPRGTSGTTAAESGSTERRESLAGITLLLPTSGWMWEEQSKNPDGTLVLHGNNFEGKFLQGGIMPFGGAEITILAKRVDGLPSTSSLVEDFVHGDRLIARENIKIASCSTTLVRSEPEEKPRVIERRAAAFLPVQHDTGSYVYRFVMSSNSEADGGAGKAIDDAFQLVLKSVAFEEGVKTSCSKAN
jgi:hypothetical protein